MNAPWVKIFFWHTTSPKTKNELSCFFLFPVATLNRLVTPSGGPEPQVGNHRHREFKVAFARMRMSLMVPSYLMCTQCAPIRKQRLLTCSTWMGLTSERLRCAVWTTLCLRSCAILYGIKSVCLHAGDGVDGARTVIRWSASSLSCVFSLLCFVPFLNYSRALLRERVTHSPLPQQHPIKATHPMPPLYLYAEYN